MIHIHANTYQINTLYPLFVYIGFTGGRYGGIIVIITGCLTLIIIFVVGAFICWREYTHLHQDPLLRDPEYSPFDCRTYLYERNSPWQPTANLPQTENILLTANQSQQTQNQSSQSEFQSLQTANHTRGLQQAHEHDNEAYLSDIGYPENRMSRRLGSNCHNIYTCSTLPQRQSVILPSYEELVVSN